MGRQIGFYMSQRDEIGFLDFVGDTGDVLLIAQTSDEEQSEQFQYFFQLQGRLYGEGCHLWNRSLSPAPKIDLIREQGYYCVNFLQSEVLNPRRSKMTDHGLSMGRIHVEDHYLTDDMESVPKSEAFLDWYDDVCSWIRRNSVDKQNGAYVLPGAKEMIEQGVALTGHSF